MLAAANIPNSRLSTVLANDAEETERQALAANFLFWKSNRYSGSTAQEIDREWAEKIAVIPEIRSGRILLRSL